MHTLIAVQAAVTGCPTQVKASGSGIFAPISRVIASLLAAVYSVIPNYAVAIIVLAVVWMIIISPLTLKSTRSMLAMQRLQPEMKRLQAEHKNDRAALNQAMMDLYKQHGVSPFGSCLPTLLPLPVFFALFNVIDGLSHKLKVNGTLCPEPNYLGVHTSMYKAIVDAGGHLNAFGLDLSKNALSGHATFLAALPYFLLLLAMMGTQWVQTQQMMSRNPQAQDNPQMKMMKYLPFFFVIIFIRFPAGVILYYAMSNLCRVGQQSLMYRFDPQVKTLAKREIREVEEEVEQIERGGRRRTETAVAATSRPKGTTTTPQRGGRLREALNAVREQQQAGRGGTGGASGRETKPGARETKPGGGNRPVGKGGAPTGTQPKTGATGAKKPPADAKGAGGATKGADAAAKAPSSPSGPPPSPSGATPSGRTGGRTGGGRTGASGSPAPASSAPNGNGGSRGTEKPPERGPGARNLPAGTGARRGKRRGR